MMTELGNERQTVASLVRDAELRPAGTAELEARVAELEELLRLVHVDVIRASGVLVDLDEKIAAALKDKP
jgi:hypothetical protein